MKPSYIREVYTCKLMMLGAKGVYAERKFVGGGEANTKSELTALASEQCSTITVVG